VELDLYYKPHFRWNYQKKERTDFNLLDIAAFRVNSLLFATTAVLVCVYGTNGRYCSSLTMPRRVLRGSLHVDFHEQRIVTRLMIEQSTWGKNIFRFWAKWKRYIDLCIFSKTFYVILFISLFQLSFSYSHIYIADRSLITDFVYLLYYIFIWYSR
jgi:hypothetical protein